MTATGTRAWREAISAIRSSPSPASTAPTISRWAPRGDGRDSGADTCERVIASGADFDAGMGLQHLLPGLAGADADRILDGKQEYLPVADLTRPGVPQDRVDDHLRVLLLDHALHPELGPQVDGDRRAAVVLGDPLLTSGPLHLADREAREPALEQILPDRLERLVADLGDDHLHDVTPAVLVAGPFAVMAVAGAGTPPRARSATGPVEPAPISGAGMNCSGYPYMPCSAMSRPASSSTDVTRRPTVLLITKKVAYEMTNTNENAATMPSA